MLLAIFSDIHANLEALEAAVRYTQHLKVGGYAVLGDTVGYGANPNECFEWAMENAAIYVAGNHEKALLDYGLRQNFTQWAYEAIVWTEKVISPEFKKAAAGLPYMRMEKQSTFVHGSPDAPEEFRYLMKFSDASSSFRKMETPLCFVGHTHVPGCFCEGARSATYLRPGILQLEPLERYILNPGSIGQPRDPDKRLSFGLYEDAQNTFEIVRLLYDAAKAAVKIRKAGLPSFLADRLL